MCRRDELLSLELPCEVSALAAVRDPLDQMPLPADPGGRADLQLVVWELLTNAVLHSGGDAGQEVSLRIRDRGDRLHVCVCDPGDGFTPRLAPPDPHRTGGRGLVIVDRLSLDWGVEPEGPTRVWCELPSDAAVRRAA